MIRHALIRLLEALQRALEREPPSFGDLLLRVHNSDYARAARQRAWERSGARGKERPS